MKPREPPKHFCWVDGTEDRMSKDEPYDHPKHFRSAKWAEYHLTEYEQKSFFPIEIIFTLGTTLQTKLSYLDRGKSIRRRGETDASTTSNCFVRFLTWQHHRPIFLRKLIRNHIINGDLYRAIVRDVLFPTFKMV